MIIPSRKSAGQKAQWIALAVAVAISMGCTATRLSDAALQTGDPEPSPVVSDAAQRRGADLPLDDAVSRRIAEAELVAKVRITGVHRLIDHALSEPGMTAVLGYVYSGVAEKVWKGESAKLLAFRLTLDDCSEKLHEGEQYLIFATTDAEGRLTLANCESTVADAEAGQLMVQLERYVQG